ncbi:hypothetical protein [Caudoviricetes sp.]|nr:hypothetical protein [Caudoviricetes sp.]
MIPLGGSATQTGATRPTRRVNMMANTSGDTAPNQFYGGGVQTGTFGNTPAPSTTGFSAPYATMTSFGPGNDLQSTQINPTASANTAQAQGYAQQAAGQVAGQSFSPWQSMSPFTSGAAGQYQNIGPVNTQTAGTTDPTASYGLLNASQNALTSGPMASGMSMLTGLGGEGAGFSYGGPGADVGKARGMTMSALESAMNGPDRMKLAGDAYDSLLARSEPQFAAAQRSLGQKAAALGRAGSGMVNTELADLGTARERELSTARKELATSAAQQTLADRLALTNAAQGVAQGFAGDDRADAGLNLAGAQLAEQGRGRQLSAANSLLNAGQFNASTLRGLGNDRFGMDATITGQRGADADRMNQGSQFNTGLAERKATFGYNADKDTYGSMVNERDAQRADEFGRGNFGLSKLSGLAGYSQGLANEDRANRNELRGERDYQTSAANQAVQDQMNSTQFDEWLRNSRAGRLQGYGALGFGNDPSGTLMQGAGYYGNQAAGNFASLGPMMQYLAQSRGQRTGG